MGTQQLGENFTFDSNDLIQDLKIVKLLNLEIYLNKNLTFREY